MPANTKVKMSGSEKNIYNKNMYKISSLGSFWKFPVVTTSKKCTKKERRTCKVAFLLIRPIVVFHSSRYLRRLR